MVREEPGADSAPALPAPGRGSELPSRCSAESRPAATTVCKGAAIVVRPWSQRSRRIDAGLAPSRWPPARVAPQSAADIDSQRVAGDTGAPACGPAAADDLSAADRRRHARPRGVNRAPLVVSRRSRGATRPEAGGLDHEARDHRGLRRIHRRRHSHARGADPAAGATSVAVHSDAHRRQDPDGRRLPEGLGRYRRSTGHRSCDDAGHDRRRAGQPVRPDQCRT